MSRVFLTAPFQRRYKAVSYTHLDVYKRQADAHGRQHLGRHLTGIGTGFFPVAVLCGDTDIGAPHGLQGGGQVDKGDPDDNTRLLYTSRCV